jgi:surface protein
MKRMFHTARAFNQPLADWNVSSVTNMRSMFNRASSFNQPLGNWDVSSASTIRMFGNSGCPKAAGEESCFYV